MTSTTKTPRSHGSYLVMCLALLLGGLTMPGSQPLASVIVQAADADAAADAVARAGGRLTYSLPIVDGVAADVTPSTLAALEAQDGLVVSPDLRVNVDAAPSPLHAATAVYPAVTGADRLWAKKVTGSGVTVAVIDTGIAKVADLSSRVIGGVDLTQEGDPYRDSFGHGTFVAGLIGGNGTSSGGAYKGMAPAAKLVSIKIADASGASDVSHVLAAIQWAVSFKSTYGIRVLNLSLGTDSTQSYRVSPLNYAVERAWDSGIVVVVSSSNLGPGAGTVSKPGDDPLVVTAGALDDVGTATRADDLMAGFSGQGPTAADGLTKPDLVASGRSVISLRAPGSAVDAAYPGSRVGTAYFKGSGTSFSAAITSGAAALVLQKTPSLTPNQVKHRLMATAANGPVGNPNIDGDGSLDVYAAAMSTSTASANQGVVRGTGTGSLDADRGTLGVVIHTTTSLVGTILNILKSLVGTLTAQDKNFDGGAYRTSEWTGSRWYESQWSGSRWYQTNWEGSRWYGSRWYNTDWYGSRWYGIAWE